MEALPPQRLAEVIAAAVARQASRTSAQLETLAPQESLQLPRQALNLLAQVHDEPYRLQIPFWSGDSLATAFPEVEANGRVEILSHLDLAQDIPPEVYKAVAEILAFVYRLTQRHQQQ